MEIRRFYVEPSDIDGKNIVIKGEEFVHITKVLRHKVGYKIIVCNDCDNMDYYATIRQISGDKLIAEVDEVTRNDTATTAKVTLFLALPKGDKLDLVAQKACELGVEAIVPFVSSNVAESKFNHDRICRIMMEACKQCGRARLVKLHDLTPFEGAVAMLKEYDKVIFACEHEHNTSLKDLSLEGCLNVAVIVGSEGGFSLDEVADITANGGRAITLGRRILRAETASIATLTMVMYELGEMA